MLLFFNQNFAKCSEGRLLSICAPQGDISQRGVIRHLLCTNLVSSQDKSADAVVIPRLAEAR